MHRLFDLPVTRGAMGARQEQNPENPYFRTPQRANSRAKSRQLHCPGAVALPSDP